LRLQRFFEIEELPSTTWQTEEIMCEEHCMKLTALDYRGRYIVRLPRRKDQGRLAESYEQKRRWFCELDRRFREHPDLR
jgi:hypothetical protein